MQKKHPVNPLLMDTTLCLGQISLCARTTVEQSARMNQSTLSKSRLSNVIKMEFLRPVA